MAFSSSSDAAAARPASRLKVSTSGGSSSSRVVLWCLYLVVGLTLLHSVWQFPSVTSPTTQLKSFAQDSQDLEAKRLRKESHVSDAASTAVGDHQKNQSLELAVAPTSARTAERATLPPTPKPTQALENTGIIISLFDQIMPLGISLIKELRCLGNHELIQVYHCFPDEISDANRELLHKQDSNIELIDVCTDMILDGKLTVDQAKQFKNWWLKPLALVHTRLQHVMILDADAIVMKDPAMVRFLPSYQETGTLFFYDRVYQYDYKTFYDSDDDGKQRLRKMLEEFDYKAFNITGGYKPSKQLQASFAWLRKTCFEMDSSMLFVDKKRVGKTPMDVLFHLITKTRHEIDFSYGDKESFWLAFELAHADYSFSPWGISVLSNIFADDLKEHPDTLCGSMAQYVPANDTKPELLYLNGRYLLEPYTVGSEETKDSILTTLFKSKPTHIAPRFPRRDREERKLPNGERYDLGCLIGYGATPLGEDFHQNLLRRRMHFLAVKTGVIETLGECSPSL